jgi:hypothetical protein
LGARQGDAFRASSVITLELMNHSPYENGNARRRSLLMRQRFFFAFPLTLIFVLFLLVYFASQRYEALLTQR